MKLFNKIYYYFKIVLYIIFLDIKMEKFVMIKVIINKVFILNF